MSLTLALTEGEPLETDRTTEFGDTCCTAAQQAAADLRCTLSAHSHSVICRAGKETQTPSAWTRAERCSSPRELKSNQHELEHTTVQIRRRVCSL